MLKINMSEMLVHPVLRFQEGTDSEFALAIRPLKASDRMSLIDAAINGGFNAVLKCVGGLVERWEGVVDAQGQPLPFQKPDADSPDPASSFDRVFGFAPFPIMVEVVVKVLTFAGLRREAENMAHVLSRASGDAGSGDGDARPTEPPSSGPATNASSGPGQS